jgi:hypothetical protein
MKNKRTLELLKEKAKRDALKVYEGDFEKFSADNIKILTKDSSQGFVPFLFNEPQRVINEAIDKQIEETGRVRVIILKARQQGISTYCAARVFWKTYFTDYSKSVVMAHDSATSDALFSMSRNIIDNMPPDLKPTLQKSNAKEILFEENKSGYRLYTAGSPEAGRGTTPTIAHLSEVGFWTHDEKILAGLFQGISQAEGTEVILESTANGASGEFWRLFQGAANGENEYLAVFIPWFATEEYRRDAPSGFERTVEEDELAEKYDLDDEQLYWRRLKIAEGGENKFRQEYPATAEEAFIVSGNTVFNQEKLNDLIATEAEAFREFNPMTGEFVEAKEGSLEIWQYPQFDVPFIIAADVAQGVGKDYSCAVVMNSNREVVAMYRNNRVDPTEFGEILFYLGRYFNNALLCVESNSIGLATLLRLDQMRYVNLYYQARIADLSSAEGIRPGFKTTMSSKPQIIGLLQNAVNEDDICIPSKTIIKELKTYISRDSGKMEAMAGCNDDTVMACAMGLEVLRTHGNKLTNDRVSWRDRIGGAIIDDDTNWL